MFDKKFIHLPLVFVKNSPAIYSHKADVTVECMRPLNLVSDVFLDIKNKILYKFIGTSNLSTFPYNNINATDMHLAFKTSPIARFF